MTMVGIGGRGLKMDERLDGWKRITLPSGGENMNFKVFLHSGCLYKSNGKL